MTEAQKEEWAKMEADLMPIAGKAATVAGEIIRAVDRLAYRWFNDGDKINCGYGRETCNATARYLEQIRGEDFSAEVWSGWMDDDEYEKFIDSLVDEMFAYLKAHPELATTANSDDSRADFIDDEMDRDVDDEEEEEEYEDYED